MTFIKIRKIDPVAFLKKDLARMLDSPKEKINGERLLKLLDQYKYDAFLRNAEKAVSVAVTEAHKQVFPKLDKAQLFDYLFLILSNIDGINASKVKRFVAAIHTNLLVTQRQNNYE